MKLLTTPRLLALSLLLAAGCTRPEEVLRPANLLSKEQMVSLLTRLHLLEARIEVSRMSPDSARALFLSQQHELLWQRNIPADDSTFERSYRYYATHGKDLDEIYGIVVDSLQAEQLRLGGTPTPPPPPHY